MNSWKQKEKEKIITFEEKAVAQNSFQIFKSDNKTFHWDINNILLLLFLVLGFIRILDIGYISKMAEKGIICILLFCFLMMFANLYRKKPLNGKLEGRLTFNSDCIEINDRKIDISEFKKISLRAYDHDGFSMPFERPYLYPTISNGTDNLLDLDLKNTEKIKLFFKIEHENQIEEIKPFIISLVKNNLMTLENASSLLQLRSDYAIDNFKEELNQKGL